MTDIQHFIGSITLNIAILLYFTSYWPQLLHNTKTSHLRELSLNFHYLLLLGNWFDLVYAVAMGMPWQYQIVSMIGMICLLYQHYQLWCLYFDNSFFQLTTAALVLFLIMSVYTLTLQTFSTDTYLLIGYISQACYIIYLVPQVLRNHNLRSAHSLSVSFLIFNGCCCLCDNLSAWCLQWPLPNKLGSVIQSILVAMLVLQWYLYQHNSKFPKNNAPALV